MTPEQITKLPLKKLTAEQRKFYFKHGYLLVKSLISESVLKNLRLSADQLWKRRFDPNLSLDFEFENDAAHERDLRQVLCAADYANGIWEYARQGIMLDSVTDLLGPDVMFRESNVSFKKPGGRGFDWHQDFVFFPSSNRTPIMTLTFLENITTAMGPTQVIPGSHLGPIYDHYDDNDNWLGLIGDQEKTKLDFDTVDSLIGPAGSVLFTNSALVHAALPNHAGTSRPMVIVGYNACDTKTYIDIPYRSRYRWRVVSGNPSNKIHREKIDLKMPPDWNTHNGVRIDNLVQNAKPI